MGLTFVGMVITQREVRSGNSKTTKNPYAISTQKLLGGAKTFVFMEIKTTESELSDPLPVGSFIKIAVDSATRQTRDSDIELIGRILELDGKAPN